VMHGDDGLDELTTTTTSTVWLYDGGQVTRTALDPADLGLERAQLPDLVGGDAGVNAQVVRDLLAGKQGPIRDIVVLNAAAVLLADAGPKPDDLVGQLRPQLDRADEAISSGAAKEKLAEWVSATQSF
jgi:anthranilate phosphoribosyltransferase